MYQYETIDQILVNERVEQFRDQTHRFLSGQLSEDEFRPLRLMNGLYVQRHAPMLRVAIPYGMLSSTQLRGLASIAREFDRGSGHFTTRQNIQYNWVQLPQVPDILAKLATVQMHAIQTSGNCVRNTTTDHYAGVSADEWVDPRPYCELIRQWSTFHPEFLYLPRKFKIAVSGSKEDRAAIRVHDIGLQIMPGEDGLSPTVQVLVGGGLGRTPMVGSVIRDRLPRHELIHYLDAILRVYNRYGRRDNKYKARIKILVKDLGVTEFTRQVEAEWEHLRGGLGLVPDTEFLRLETAFTPPNYRRLENIDLKHTNPSFNRWIRHNTTPHKIPGYRIVTISLKPHGLPPGDMSAEQMEKVAQLSDDYSGGELRVSHEQNLILADVEQTCLYAVWEALVEQGLASPNVGLLTNIIACPGGDYCSLANARSLPVAAQIQARFDDWDYLHDLGPIDLNISGCINACGHHHIGHIGILGVDKDGAEFYQVTLGGSQGEKAALGKVIGPSFSATEIAPAVERIIHRYVEVRHEDEIFIDVVRRMGLETFRQVAYAGN